MPREIIAANSALTCLCREVAAGAVATGDLSTEQFDDFVAELHKKIVSARGDARLQLYDGPSARECCEMSWSEAVEFLRCFWQGIGTDLWVHEDDAADVCYSEPQNDHTCDDECRSDGCWFNEESGYHCVDAAVVGRAIFGDELFQYIR